MRKNAPELPRPCRGHPPGEQKVQESLLGWPNPDVPRVIDAVDAVGKQLIQGDPHPSRRPAGCRFSGKNLKNTPLFLAGGGWGRGIQINGKIGQPKAKFFRN